MKAIKSNVTETIAATSSFSARYANNTKRLLRKLANVESLLGAIDPNTWEGKKVVVVNGKFLGQVGEIKSAGNGWVQIDTPTGEIAKRASELGVLDGDDSFTDLEWTKSDHQDGGSLDSSLDAVEELTRRPNSKKRNRGDDENLYARPYIAPNSSQVIPVDCDDAEDCEWASKHSGMLPMQDAIYLKSRREYINKYVQKARKRLCNRPNLSEWKIKLNASLFSDQVAEIQAARAFDESFCISCGLERWPGAKFCWNQCCLSSPVYDSQKAQEKLLESMESVTRTASLATQLNPITSHLLLRQGPAHFLSAYQLASNTYPSSNDSHNEVMISQSMAKFADVICSPATTLAAESPYQYDSSLQQETISLGNYDCEYYSRSSDLDDSLAASCGKDELSSKNFQQIINTSVRSISMPI